MWANTPALCKEFDQVRLAGFDPTGRDIGYLTFNRKLSRKHLIHKHLKGGVAWRDRFHQIVHAVTGRYAICHLVELSDIILEPVKCRFSMRAQRDRHHNSCKINNPFQSQFGVKSTNKPRRFSEERLEIRDYHFDGIEIGAVGRQEKEPCADLAQYAGCSGALVAGQVVHCLAGACAACSREG